MFYYRPKAMDVKCGVFVFLIFASLISVARAQSTDDGGLILTSTLPGSVETNTETNMTASSLLTNNVVQTVSKETNILTSSVAPSANAVQITSSVASNEVTSHVASNVAHQNSGQVTSVTQSSPVLVMHNLPSSSVISTKTFQSSSLSSSELLSSPASVTKSSNNMEASESSQTIQNQLSNIELSSADNQMTSFQNILNLSSVYKSSMSASQNQKNTLSSSHIQLETRYSAYFQTSSQFSSGTDSESSSTPVHYSQSLEESTSNHKVQGTIIYSSGLTDSQSTYSLLNQQSSLKLMSESEEIHISTPTKSAGMDSVQTSFYSTFHFWTTEVEKETHSTSNVVQSQSDVTPFLSRQENMSFTGTPDHTEVPATGIASSGSSSDASDFTQTSTVLSTISSAFLSDSVLKTAVTTDIESSSEHYTLQSGTEGTSASMTTKTDIYTIQSSSTENLNRISTQSQSMILNSSEILSMESHLSSVISPTPTLDTNSDIISIHTSSFSLVTHSYSSASDFLSSSFNITFVPENSDLQIISSVLSVAANSSNHLSSSLFIVTADLVTTGNSLTSDFKNSAASLTTVNINSGGQSLLSESVEITMSLQDSLVVTSLTEATTEPLATEIFTAPVLLNSSAVSIHGESSHLVSPSNTFGNLGSTLMTMDSVSQRSQTVSMVIESLDGSFSIGHSRSASQEMLDTSLITESSIHQTLSVSQSESNTQTASISDLTGESDTLSMETTSIAMTTSAILPITPTSTEVIMSSGISSDLSHSLQTNPSINATPATKIETTSGLASTGGFYSVSPLSSEHDSVTIGINGSTVPTIMESTAISDNSTTITTPLSTPSSYLQTEISTEITSEIESIVLTSTLFSDMVSESPFVTHLSSVNVSTTPMYDGNISTNSESLLISTPEREISSKSVTSEGMNVSFVDMTSTLSEFSTPVVQNSGVQSPGLSDMFNTTTPVSTDMNTLNESHVTSVSIPSTDTYSLESSTPLKIFTTPVMPDNESTIFTTSTEKLNVTAGPIVSTFTSFSTVTTTIQSQDSFEFTETGLMLSPSTVEMESTGNFVSESGIESDVTLAMSTSINSSIVTVSHSAVEILSTSDFLSVQTLSTSVTPLNETVVSDLVSSTQNASVFMSEIQTLSPITSMFELTESTLLTVYPPSVSSNNLTVELITSSYVDTSDVYSTAIITSYSDITSPSVSTTMLVFSTADSGLNSSSYIAQISPSIAELTSSELSPPVTMDTETVLPTENTVILKSSVLSSVLSASEVILTSSEIGNSSSLTPSVTSSQEPEPLLTSSEIGNSSSLTSSVTSSQEPEPLLTSSEIANSSSLTPSVTSSQEPEPLLTSSEIANSSSLTPSVTSSQEPEPLLTSTVTVNSLVTESTLSVVSLPSASFTFSVTSSTGFLASDLTPSTVVSTESNFSVTASSNLDLSTINVPVESSTMNSSQQSVVMTTPLSTSAISSSTQIVPTPVSSSHSPSPSSTTVMLGTSTQAPTNSSEGQTKLVSSEQTVLTTEFSSAAMELTSTKIVNATSSIELSSILNEMTTVSLNSTLYITTTNPDTDSITDTGITDVNSTIDITPTFVPDNNTITPSSTVNVTIETTVTMPTSVIVTTTTRPPTTTTISTTTKPPVTTTVDVISQYWIVTVLKVPLNVNVTNELFKSSMETKLANAYIAAYERERLIAEGNYQPLRKKREIVGDTTVKIQNVTRTPNSGSVSLVYTIDKNGTQVPSSQAVRTLGLLSDMEMALQLGFVVSSKADTYYGSKSNGVTPDEEASNLWIVGVAVGGIILIIIVIWVLFCCIIKKRGPSDEEMKDSTQPHLLKMREKRGSQGDESVEMVQSPSSSTTNVKKRQSYQVTSNGQLEKDDPVYASVKKPGKQKDASSAGDSVTMTSDNMDLIPSPSKKRKKKKKKSQEQDDFDELEAENYVMASQPYHTSHPIPEPTHFSLEEEEEYQKKKASERKKNKQRMREKRKKDRQKKEDTEDMMKEYLAVQEEIDTVLDSHTVEGEMPDVFKTKKSPKKKSKKKREGEENAGYEEQENISEAKKRMHKLLDDAFALIQPTLDGEDGLDSTENSKDPIDDKVTHADDSVDCKQSSVSDPGLCSSSGNRSPVSKFKERNKVFPTDIGDNEDLGEKKDLQNEEKKHEPMTVTPSYQSSRRPGLTTWSPYRASDEVALISMPQTLQMPADKGDNETEKRSRNGKRPPVHLPDYVPNTSDKFAKDTPKPIILRTLSSDRTKQSSNPATNSYSVKGKDDLEMKTSGLIGQKPREKIDSDPKSKRYDMNSVNGDLSQKPPLKHQKPYKLTPEGEDETDVVSKSIQAGQTPENTLKAIRNELQGIVSPTVVSVAPQKRGKSVTGGLVDIA